MVEHETKAYDRCPRCKSEQIEGTDTMHGWNGLAVEYLCCQNCGLDFEQHYQYVSTVGEWEDTGEEWQ